jgi:predicted TIM-barrel fold metal-dependent hydrolase
MAFPHIRSLAARLVGLVLAIAAVGARAAELPMIDAHSQADQHIALEEIIGLMDKAGVARTILSQRARTRPEDLIAFAQRHPERITPAVRTKGQSVRQVKELVRRYSYGAMAEVLMWHREKTRRTVTTKSGETQAPPQRVMPPDHPKSQKLLAVARRNEWPFIPHIEFGSAGADAAPFMVKLESMLRRNRDHPFLLIHMGMLERAEVERLIETHPNIHFIPAHSDPLSVKRSDSPFTKMFKGRSLTAEWKALIVAHPERFVLGFDNVFENHWRKHYVKQAAIWREALLELPPDVAHAVAHRNAERLWRLPALE